MKRWTRWPLRLLAGAGLLLALAVGFVLVAVHQLDAPWLKPRVQRWIAGVAGFDVDWRSIRVDLRAGVHLDGFEVKSPPAFRDRAPDLLRADAVDVDASVFSGIRAIRISNADVTLIQEGSHGSWDSRVTATAPAKEPGLSLKLSTLFSKPPPIPAASLDGGSITWIKVDPGQPVQRVRVSGLSLNLQGWKVTMGTATKPVHLDAKYERGESEHAAALDVEASASADRRGLAADIKMKVERQDWAPDLSVGELLSLRLGAKFETADRRIDVNMDRAQLLDDAVTLKGGGALPDEPAAFPMVHDVDGALDLERLAAFLAPLKLPVSVDRGTLRFRSKNTNEIDIDGNAGKVVLEMSGTTVSLARASLTATLRPGGPHFLRAKLNGHCTAAAAGAKPWFNEDVRADLQADEVAKDFSRARMRGTVAGRWGELAIDDKHHAHHEAAQIIFRLPSLALLRPFLPKTPWPVNWGGASAEGKIDAHVQLGSKRPKLHQTSEVTLQNLAVRLPAGPLAVRSIVANLRSEGTAQDHHAEVRLRLAGAQWREGTPSDQTLDATFDFAEASGVHLILKTEGALAPSVSAELQAHIDRARHELLSEFSASVSRASRFATFLKEMPRTAGRLDLASLEATLSGRARLQGISRFEPRLPASARGDAQLRGTIRNVRWLGAAQSASIASVGFEATAKGDAQQATIDGQLDLRGAKFALDDDSYSAEPISFHFSAALKPRSGEASAQGELNVRRVLVSEGFGYPLDGLKLSFSLERERDGVIHIRNAALANPGAGTMLELQGGLALNEIPGKLSAQGSITQDLSKVWQNPDVFSGQGRAELRFSVESSDLLVFETSAVLRLAGVGLRMPARGLSAEGVDSEIPLVSAFAHTPQGFAIVRGHRLNLYSALRFADQHPLFSRRSYLSIRRLVTPQVTLESFAGNLKVDHNLIELDQMEMSVRGGHLAGQCLIDTDAKNLRAQAQLRAEGILSSHGEPFDGNAALSVSLRDRSVDGRAEIQRIGRQHLLDLLDLEDPQHSLLAFNRVRKALGLGYPDKVKITFDRGFANVHIAFGGLAKLVKVDDLRGIPVEPLIDKYLAEER